jgi:serine/threonine protein kinase
MALPGYSDFRLLTQGGEGTIYRARQDGLDREVAVKVLQVDDPATLARFRRELEITVRLGRQHPHIVTVLDTGIVPSGHPCIVMEYYDLGSLHDRLRAHGPLPLGEVVAAGIAVADALAFAHGQGFLHRDVKPQNVLVLPTSYVLADFGIARTADAGHSASLEMVSYRHAAPQMLNGEKPAASDDLWSLGSTLFTLLDGQPPFTSNDPDEDTMLSYLGRVRSAEPRRLTRPDVPPELVDVIDRCLRKPREERFPDAAALRSALAAVDTQPRDWVMPTVSTVDPDSTRMAVLKAPEHTERFPDGPTATLDFGPKPVVEDAKPVTTPPPPETWATQLADLTVRHHSDAPVMPDFGPRASYPDPVAYIDAPPAVTQPVVPQAIAEPVPPRRGRRGLVLFAVAALVVGVVAGILLTRPDQTGQTPVAGPATTSTTATTTTDAPGPVGGDPRFVPTLKSVEDHGRSVDLTWTDPSEGNAEFVVVDVTGAKGKALLSLGAGTTTHTVEDLDPKAEKYCFQILAIGLEDPSTQRGTSAPTCAVRNG